MRQERTRQPEHRKKKGPVCFKCGTPASPAFLKRCGRELHFVCGEHR